MKIEELKRWFQDRPVWLQKAAKHIIEVGKLKDKDYIELYKNCLDEVKEQFEKSDTDIPINQLLSQRVSDSTIKLKSIRNIKGVNKLSPKKPLKFGDKNLSVIYGLNGSGKSGYVRILKQICGVKTNLPLLSNVYNSFESERKCTIEYQKGSKSETKEWNVFEKPIDDLICIDIFDSECALSYVTNENEVTYEPKILLFFSDLVCACEEVSFRINSEIDRNRSKKPLLPLEYQSTEGGRWYNKDLSKNTTEQCLNKYCSWIEDHKRELSEIQKRLAQEDPGKKAEEIRKKNRYLRELIDNTINLLHGLSNERYIEISQLKAEYIQAKETAKAVAERVFQKAPLTGVGSEIWKRLWQYAKEYSETVAYKGQHFPVISDGALCVLCHQQLDGDAKSRFISFERFVKEEAQRTVESSKKSLERIIDSLPEISDQQILKTKFDAAGLQLDNTQLINLYIELENRKNQLLNTGIQFDLIPLPSIEQWKNGAENTVIDNEKEAQQYDEDAKNLNRDVLLAKQKELQARKWLSQQINSIKEEIERLRYIEILSSARGLTNTRGLSEKKDKLSAELITEDFVRRFNSELEELKADKVRVELYKSRTKKGKAFHHIRLQGVSSQSVEAVDILSEGELRIVALSAFLADVIGGQHSAPFVFDDPISSLDQNFEEEVAQRLVKLSKERQVIIFTHRLPILGLLEEYAKRNNIEFNALCVKEEPWGTGEPGGIPLFVKNPNKALNDLIKQLPVAKDCLENEGRDAYEKIAKSFCSDFRIIIENVIESILISEIVKRHRRKIHSQEIKQLAKINSNDCRFLDNLMTNYSKLLHSPTHEAPINFPEPEQLKEDFESLKRWIKEFRKRDIH